MKGRGRGEGLPPKGGLLAEVSLDFLASGETESVGAGNVALGVVAVENVAALAHADDALDAPEGVVEVEVAGLDLGEGVRVRVVHFVLENRGAAPCRKLFLVFFCGKFRANRTEKVCQYVKLRMRALLQFFYNSAVSIRITT